MADLSTPRTAGPSTPRARSGVSSGVWALGDPCHTGSCRLPPARGSVDATGLAHLKGGRRAVPLEDRSTCKPWLSGEMLSRKKNLLQSIADCLVESRESWEERGAEPRVPQLHRLALLSSCSHGHLIPLWPKGEERRYHRRF